MRSGFMILGFVMAYGLVAALPSPVPAQSFWLDQEPDQLSLELVRPGVSDPVGMKAGSFAAFATAAVVVGEDLLVVLEVPFSLAQADFPGAGTSTVVGNTYVGLQSIPGGETGLRFSLGVRLPTAPNGASGSAARTVGASSSYTDRLEAFASDLVGLEMQFRYVWQVGPAAYVSGRAGSIFDASTAAGGGAEVFATYGAKGWIEGDGFRVGTGASGRTWLTAEGVPFLDRGFYEIGFWGDYDLGRFRPGIRVQLPVGENLPDVVDNVIAVNVQYRLR